MIAKAEFDKTEQGLKQRVRALEAFLADVYGTGQLFNDRIMPRSVVTTSSNFVRAIAGYKPHNVVRIHVAGIDLIRDGDGQLRVLEDNARIPSGVSYVLTNRQATVAALPEAVSRHNIARVDDYPARLRSALAKAAPPGVADPNIVVLTPGVYNSAYFEHAMLARTMGVSLVEGRDLVVRQGVAYPRTTDGLEQVHVIYRRVDDEFLDPVKFLPDSLLGCAGLLSAQANGTLTIANSVGNGIADDKLAYSFVPDMIRYYLDEEPRLPNVDTWRLEEPEHREEVLDRMDELVIKPVDGSGGKGIVMGPMCEKKELDAARKRIIADPPRLDRPTVGPVVHRAHDDEEGHATTPRGPASLHHQRRRGHVGRTGWPDPRRTAGGADDRELLTGWRLQGHLGGVHGGIRAGVGDREDRSGHRARLRDARTSGELGARQS